MTYSITFTATTVTVRKGTYCVRSTTNPDLIGAYASLHALHGDLVLPHIWQDMLSRPAGHKPQAQANREFSTVQPHMPIGGAKTAPMFSPTMQPRVQKSFGLRAHGVETAYRSEDYLINDKPVIIKTGPVRSFLDPIAKFRSE